MVLAVTATSNLTAGKPFRAPGKILFCAMNRGVSLVLGPFHHGWKTAWAHLNFLQSYFSH
jgi:hypothetical protein